MIEGIKKLKKSRKSKKSKYSRGSKDLMNLRNSRGSKDLKSLKKSRGSKNSNNSYKIISRPIISLLLGLGCLSAVLLVTMLATQEGQRPTKRILKSKEQQQETADNSNPGNQVFGVIKSIDTEKKQLALYDIENEETILYAYTGGTSITDQYGKQMAMSQLTPSLMVEAIYSPKNNKLMEISLSKKAWEYVRVKDFHIDRSSKIMQLANRKYKYTEDILVLDGQDYVPISHLVEQDELTVRGYDQTIWSITVTRGHGTVKLVDYESFLGASITIGYEAMQQVAEDTMITVREGNFNLTLENSKYTATKNITVYRNQETIVSLGDMGPEAEKQSRVTFDITPFGADLFIDGEISSYGSPLEIPYGKHRIEVSLDGYTSYEGYFIVDSAGKTMVINLPVRSSKQKATATETDSTDQQSDNLDSNTPDSQNEEELPADNSDPDTTDDSTQNNTPTTDNDQVDEDQIVDAKHRIYIQNPQGASVYLDGEYMTTSPGSFKKIIGSHVLTFIKEGYETMSYTVDILNDNLDTYFNMPDLVKE